MTAATTGERYLSVAQAADLLGLCKRSVERMSVEDPARQGSIPFYDIAPGRRRRRLRFLGSELREWVEMNCPPAADFKRIMATRRRGRGGNR